LKSASHGVRSEPARFSGSARIRFCTSGPARLANLDLSQNFRFLGYGGVRLTLELR
jgi:hypothetical protein